MYRNHSMDAYAWYGIRSVFHLPLRVGQLEVIVHFLELHTRERVGTHAHVSTPHTQKQSSIALGTRRRGRECVHGSTHPRSALAAALADDHRHLHEALVFGQVARGAESGCKRLLLCR